MTLWSTRVIAAKNREELETAARALDRVLRAGHYWVPHWYKASNSIAYWDKFSRPETKPRFDRGILDTWWYDGAKAKCRGYERRHEGREAEREAFEALAYLGVIALVVAGFGLVRLEWQALTMPPISCAASC